MTPEERDLIAGLAERLRNADTDTKDREADAFIRDIVARQPAAPYQLVQTVLVQEHALTNAQTRIAALERQVSDLQARSRESAAEAQGGSGSGGGVGSFLSGLLGRPSASGSGAASPDRPRAGSVPPPLPRVVPLSQQQQPGAAAYGAAPGQPPQGGGYPSTMNMPPSAGGGFLRGALATAAGVAGGAMLFQGLQGLMGHNSGLFGGAGGGQHGGAGGHLAGADSHNVTNNYYGERRQRRQQRRHRRRRSGKPQRHAPPVERTGGRKRLRKRGGPLRRFRRF